MLTRPDRTFTGTMFRVRGSALADIWPLLIAAFVVSEVLTWAHEWWPEYWVDLTPLPFSLVGLALSIFLGFRNNACYDRWWEARKLWGRLINTSRSSARQGLTLIRGEGADQVATRWVRMQMAYAHALRLHLRKQLDRAAELEAFLPVEEVAALRGERNLPIGLLHRMGLLARDAMDRGLVDRFHLPVLEATLTDLANIQGGCERIKNTPVPLSYTELTHRIVGLYVILLPFGIVNEVGHATPLVVVFVAFCFLGLDDVGSQIEDPFEEDPNDLPLMQISRMIENDLRQRLGETDLLPDIQPERGVLL